METKDTMTAGEIAVKVWNMAINTSEQGYYTVRTNTLEWAMDEIEARENEAKKAGMREAIKVYTPYVKVLEEENGSLVGFASTHGWSSLEVEFGKQCRKKIKVLKAKAKLKERGNNG